MVNRTVVIGLGETGFPLFNIIREFDRAAYGCDLKRQIGEKPESTEFLNICLPYIGIDDFVGVVKKYQIEYSPILTIIHTTVPIGTTSKIGNAVHSPILGKHGRMQDDILTYTKWVGGERASLAAEYLNESRIKTRVVSTSEETELMKLMCLAKYGMSIAFSVYQKDLCDKYNVNYDDVYEWDSNYNNGVLPSYKRPLISPPNNRKIGGHCVITGTRILNDLYKNDILGEILKYE
jgi:hypothetical protein